MTQASQQVQGRNYRARLAGRSISALLAIGCSLENACHMVASSFGLTLGEALEAWGRS